MCCLGCEVGAMCGVFQSLEMVRTMKCQLDFCFLEEYL